MAAAVVTAGGSVGPLCSGVFSPAVFVGGSTVVAAAAAVAVPVVLGLGARTAFERAQDDGGAIGNRRCNRRRG